MTDEPITRIQRALARARRATLLLDGAAAATRPGAAPPLLHTDARGFPGFCCEPDSAIGQAGRRGAGAVLEIVDDSTGDTVAFLGRLDVCGTEVVDGQALAVVALEPHRIVLESGSSGLGGTASAGGPAVAHVVDASEYRRGCSGFGPARDRLVDHLNRAHAPTLRRLARPDGDVGYAHLTDPQPGGVSLEWVDRHGAHVRRLGFPRPAHDVAEFTAALREILRGSARLRD